MKTNLLQELLNKKLNDRGLSYREASREIGVSHTTVTRVAQGISAPDIDSLIAICEWLGVTPSYILDSELSGSESLSAKIATLIEANPELQSVFQEAINRVEVGKLDPAVLQDLLAYAAFRLRMSRVNIDKKEN